MDNRWIWASRLLKEWDLNPRQNYTEPMLLNKELLIENN